MDGIEAGPATGEDAAAPERTMMVSTMPMTRAASVSTGPDPPLREVKKELLATRLLKDTGGFR